jgi:hypothetical protein
LTPPTPRAADSQDHGERPEEVSGPGSNLDSGLRPLARALIELALQLAEEEQQDDEEKTA